MSVFVLRIGEKLARRHSHVLRNCNVLLRFLQELCLAYNFYSRRPKKGFGWALISKTLTSRAVQPTGVFFEKPLPPPPFNSRPVCEIDSSSRGFPDSTIVLVPVVATVWRWDSWAPVIHTGFRFSALSESASRSRCHLDAPPSESGPLEISVLLKDPFDERYGIFFSSGKCALTWERALNNLSLVQTSN